MADIFVSYANKDRDTAQRIASALEAVGHSVWWDREIRGGENFDEAIERELDLASAVIVLWSKQSASSNWVRSEAAAAVERGVLVPVFIEQIKLPLEFRRKQTIDLTSWSGDPEAYEFGLVRQAIALHLSPVTHLPTSPASADRTRTVPKSQQKLPFFSTPVSILRAGIKAVPAVKYALGIAGIGAALAIVSTFFTSTLAALIGIGLMLILMTLLVVFASIAGLARKELRNPALVFTWSILLIFLGLVGLFISSIFFSWPKPIEQILSIGQRPAESDSPNRLVGNLIVNGGFEQISTTGFPYKWDLRKWQSIGEGIIDNLVAHSGSHSARVSSAIPGHVRWAQVVSVKKDTTYVLSAMMKTIGITHAENREYVLGANIGVLGLTDHGEEIVKYSEPVLGTNNWQTATLRFESGSYDKIMIVLELGGYRAIAHGTAWFDDIRLEAEVVPMQDRHK